MILLEYNKQHIHSDNIYIVAYIKNMIIMVKQEI